MESLESRQVLATWDPAGPAPFINGGSEKVSPNNENVGAVHAVLAHPTDANVLYVGAVNGGIWKTNNAQAERPNWTPLTDYLVSNSIGAMAMDPDNPQRIVAGYGRYSAFFKQGGELGGLILTEDGGQTWRRIEDPLLVGQNISGVTIQGNLILASAGASTPFRTGPQPLPTGGLYRSTDAGRTWTSLQLLTPDPLFPDDIVPFEAFDLVSDPTDSDRYYVSVGDQGVFRTEDGGQNWNNVTATNPRIATVYQTFRDLGWVNNNLEMSVAKNGRLYIAITANGQPMYFGYSDTQGDTWFEMDIPQTQEANGGAVGISPRPKPGAQGYIHFSIVADANDPNTVYVGGDRQDGNVSFATGNSVGARGFSGKLFRGDTRRPSIGNTLNNAGFVAFNGYSTQWEHLTHSDAIAAMPEGGTRRGSSPHADSRDMAFDAAGNLIEVDDGGVFRRTSPQNNKGDWFSIGNNLQVSELHDVAYDSVSNIIVAGSQDNGNIQQIAAGSMQWEVMPIINQLIDIAVYRTSTGDGGDVAIDDTSTPGMSYRYTSLQSLGFFRRQVFDSSNHLVSEKLLTSPIVGNFVTPVVLNRLTPTNLVVGGAQGIFESTNRGDSFTQILGPGDVAFGVLEPAQTAIISGGHRNGVANPALLYIGTGNEVFVRTASREKLRLSNQQYPGGLVRDIAVDRQDWANAYVIDRDDVFVTHDTGDQWHSITGDLREVTRGVRELRSLEFVRGPSGEGFVVVGTDTGVFVMAESKPGQWTELGQVPHAPVYEMEYDATDNVLVAATLGRGAFLLKNAAAEIDDVGSQKVKPTSASGLVWKDLNGDGVRNPNEPGYAGITVYVDVNGDDVLSLCDPAVTTSANGTYTLRNVPPGNFAVRVRMQPGMSMTAPKAGEYVVSFGSSQEYSNLNFGLREGVGPNEGFDFGDAPTPFPTTLARNGASHGIRAGFQLGATIDGDSDGLPTAGADGDDTTGLDDEDGVRLLGELAVGGRSTLEITVNNGSNPAGLLQGWIDFNGDGSWDSAGEQIFRDVPVQQGVNLLSFNVPASTQPGAKFARFRYAYERGLSFSGRALAGEVEDYVMEVVEGGPTAVNDSYQVRRNSKDNFLAVLENDKIQANSGTVISAIAQGSAGGVVTIAAGGNGLVYSPAFGFTGTETFSYTLRDSAGLTSSANVSVFVKPDLASIRLGAADTSGKPITSIAAGQQFLLQAFVQDLRTPVAGGVFAAYLDIDYPATAASVSGAIQYGDDYPNGQSGATNVPGLIDEAGGFDGIDRLGGDEGLLLSIPMQAVQPGSITFVPNQADLQPEHAVLLFDLNDPAPLDQVEFRPFTLTVTSNTPVAARRNPNNPLDVNDDTQVSPFDALLVINDLNDLMQAEGEDSPFYLDVNGDGRISPFDALLVINELNASRAEGEPTDLAQVAAAVAGQKGNSGPAAWDLALAALSLDAAGLDPFGSDDNG